jgi:DNA-directed RNA polymerase specialized sigma24 family protein
MMNAATYSACYRSASRRLRRLTTDPQLIDALAHDTIVSVWSRATDDTPTDELPKLAYRRAFWLFREYLAQLGRDQAKCSLSRGLESVADTTQPEPMPELATSPQEIDDLISDPRLSDFALLLAFLPDLSTEDVGAALGISSTTAYRYRLRLQSDLGQSQVSYSVCSALYACLD